MLFHEPQGRTPLSEPHSLVSGSEDGFGRLWQRTFTARLGRGVSPREVIDEWKRHYGDLWPAGSRFYGRRMEPGEQAPITVGTGTGVSLVSSVHVFHSDDDSFAFLTADSHMFSGWIAFSAGQYDGETVARVQMLIRPHDPLYELSWPVMSRFEDRFWSTTLANLARRLGTGDVTVQSSTRLVDGRRLWRNAGNLWHNAPLRAAVNVATTPMRALLGWRAV